MRMFLLILAAFLADVAVDAERAASPVLVVFGDSLVDVGNNIYLNSTVRADFPPYGMDYFHHPTGRFSNGRNSVDFIAQYLGIPFPLPSLNPQYNLSIGINFASGGSGILNGTRSSSRVMNLASQLKLFHQIRSKHGLSHGHLSKTLFVISSGGNDLLEYMANPAAANKSQSDLYVQAMANGIHNTVQELYRAGARKIVVYGIGPIGCVPAIVAVTSGNSCFQLGNDLALAFNNATLEVLTDLSQKWPKLNTVFTKVYDLVSDLTLTNDNSYGFTAEETACCGGGEFNAQARCGSNGTSVCSDRSRYFFWDSVHPTENADELLVNLAWEGGTSFATPFNISTLISPWF